AVRGEELLVDAGRRHGHAVQGDDVAVSLRGSYGGRSSERHPPGVAVWLNPLAAQLAADLDEEAVDGEGDKELGYLIYGEPLGDRREVQRHPARLQNAATVTVDDDALPTAADACRADSIRWRNL